jgi:hypothetical protein
MGLLDLFSRDKNQQRQDRDAAKSALQEAEDPGSDAHGAVSRLIAKVLDVGIDGRGAFAGAAKVAAKARANKDKTEEAIDAVIAQHVRGGALGGFVTSLGGFATLAAAIPANVFEFYVQATRMVAAVAELRGYNTAAPEVRTAVLLTLIGNDSDEVLKKAGVPITAATPGGVVSSVVLGRLPKSALMLVNKAVGFRILRSVGERTLFRLGRLVPVVGAVLGAGLDGYLMRQLGTAARREFPQRAV